MNNYYVYEWIRLDTNEPFYVGKGSGDRWKSMKRGNNHHFNNIVKSIPVSVNILHNDLEESTAFEYECWYINEYKYVNGYDIVNLTDGGDSPPHGSGDKNNNYGNKWTLEQKLKASKRIKESEVYLGTNNPRATKIMCVETGEIFSLIKDAAMKHNMKTYGSISFALKNKHRIAYECHWCKIDEKNEENMKDEFYRFIYLVECYSECGLNVAIVCIEDMKIFKSKTEFVKFSGISYKRLSHHFKNQESIIHNNKEYIFAKYYSRIMQ